MELTKKIQSWDTSGHPDRFVGIAVTALLHAAAVVALLQYEPVRSALTEAVPIMVNLIVPQPIVEKPQQLPKPLPVKPKIEQAKAPEPPPLITAAPEAPAPVTVAPPQPVPVEPSPPPPVLAALPSAPVVPPNFNADYLENPPPPYPALARRMGEQGRVLLRVLVNAKGTADKVELRSSSGSHRLDDIALETVKRWRFVAARQGDQAVAAWVLVPISFSLRS